MDTLLAISLRALMRRTNWVRYRHMLDDDTFPNTQASAIYSLLRDMHESSKKDIDERALRSAVDATSSGDRCDELQQVVSNIMEEDEPDEDQTDYAFRQYVARGKATRAARMVVTHRDSPVFDYGVPAKLLADAERIATGSRVEVVESREAALPGDPEMEREVVPLGLSDRLDAALAGGVGRGELLVIMAPQNVGKTSYLWRATSNAALAGENCWAATLEIALRKCYGRYYQCLTGLTNTEMLSARRLINQRRKQVAGHVWFNDYRGRGKLTPSQLHAELEQARDEGKDISFVMIDYAGIMKPDGARYNRGDHLIKGEMVVDLRGVAAEFDIPIITAWQVNRIGSTKLVFGPEDVADSWEVCQHADIILGLNQTREERRENVMRIKVMKQREDTDFPLVYVHSDLRRMNICDLEGAPDDATESPDA